MKSLGELSKPLTSSGQVSRNSKSLKDQFATERARLLFGQFRKGEANDPAIYVASIAAMLARYPEQVITHVTDPRTGLAIESDWFPTVKEVFEACERAMTPIRNAEKRQATTDEMLARREQPRARQTIEELREKYGPTWRMNLIEDGPPRELVRRLAEITDRSIVRQYDAMGREPLTSGGMLISPSLRKNLSE